MIFKPATAILALTIGLFLAGCGGSAPVNNGNVPKSNLSNPNSNHESNGNSPVDTVKKPATQTSNNAPTTGPVVRAYFEALKNKDDASLNSIMSAQYLKTVSTDMKKEKKTSMSLYLAEYDGVSDKPIEVQNERIEGDKAVVEIKGANFINWTPYILIREGGSWKWTGQSPDLDSVKQGPAASPATK